jgi:hypothetical protein
MTPMSLPPSAETLGAGEPRPDAGQGPGDKASRTGRFGSAEEVATEHAALLSRLPDQTGPSDFQPIIQFIEKAAATGAVLYNPEDRKQVQGLIDYWAASLLTESRETAKDGAASRIKPPSTVLTPFDPETIRRAAAAADDWLATLSDTDRMTARRILLRLVRLLKDGVKFDPVPTVRATLYDLDAPERVDAVVDGLAASGIVRVTRSPSPELDRIALRFPGLTTTWPTYVDMLADRKRFRDAVLAWDRAGRPTSALATGAQLEEARSYFDRDNLEREFLEQSRLWEWRENARNRILKYVFGGLALAALVGWIAAGINYHRAKRDQQTLREKQQLSNTRLFVRGLGELATARTLPEQKIAKKRWHTLLQQFENDPQAAALLALNLSELQESACCQDGPVHLSTGEIAEIRRLRNPILGLGNDLLAKTFESMRSVSFAMVTLSAKQAVEELKAGKLYSEVEPYAREFWTQYWGEMLLVEGDKVNDAMIAFGQILWQIRLDVEKPNQHLANKINDRLQAVTGRYPDDKKKQLSAVLTDLPLNVRSFDQVDTRAKELQIDDNDRSRIQDELSQIRKEAINRPVANQKLVSELQEKLQPLLDALQREEGKPIPRYTGVPPR